MHVTILFLLRVGRMPSVIIEQIGKLNVVEVPHLLQNSQRRITPSSLISLKASGTAVECLGRFLLRKARLDPGSLEKTLRVRTSYMIRFFSCKNRLHKNDESNRNCCQHFTGFDLYCPRHIWRVMKKIDPV